MALGVGVCCSLEVWHWQRTAVLSTCQCHVTMASCDTGIITTRPVWSGSGPAMCGGACLWTLTELWAATQPCDPEVGSGCVSLWLSLHGTTPHGVSVGECVRVLRLCPSRL